MKIIHISDLHLNSYYKNSRLEEINFILGFISREKFDHLIITGDLTDNADYKDFEILRNLFKKYDLLRGDRLSLMIGNHDIYGGITTPDDIFTFHQKCEKINYHLRLNEFYLHFFETFENCSYRNDYFPYVKIFEDILILAVNSVMEYSKIKNPFASNGKISLNQYLEISDILEENSFLKRKVIFTHHHFNKIDSAETVGLQNVWRNIEKQTLKLKNKTRLFNLFKEHNIDLVLHGHYHKSCEYTRKGIRFLNAGATIIDNISNQVNLNYINIDRDSLTIEIKKIDMNNPETIRKSSGRVLTDFQNSGLILQ